MSLIGGPLRLLMLIGLFSAISLVGQTPQPPVAPVIGHRETRYGTTVVDNYFWLREKSNPEVIKYLEKENAYTEAMTKGLKPFEDALYSEMLSHKTVNIMRQNAIGNTYYKGALPWYVDEVDVQWTSTASGCHRRPTRVCPY